MSLKRKVGSQGVIWVIVPLMCHLTDVYLHKTCQKEQEEKDI